MIISRKVSNSFQDREVAVANEMFNKSEVILHLKFTHIIRNLEFNSGSDNIEVKYGRMFVRPSMSMDRIRCD